MPCPESDLDRETRPEWLEEFAAQGIRQLEDTLSVHAAFQLAYPDPETDDA